MGEEERDDELTELADDLIVTEGRGDTPFGLYVLTADDPHTELARAVEREVFFEFFGNTPQLLAEEYGPYEGASLFLCIVDHLRRQPAGVLRVILPSPAGLKSLHDLTTAWDEPADAVLARAGLDVEPGRMWDISTLAVSREYRGAASSGLVSLGLYQGLNMVAGCTDVTHAVAILDLVVLDLLQKNFQRPFTPFPGLEPRRYLDSASSLPVWVDAVEYRARVALLDADLYELLFAGRGLEAVVSSPLIGLDAPGEERWFRTA